MKTISLRAGNAFQCFSATIGAHTIKINLRWLARYGYFSVDIHHSKNQVITLGRALHPNIDLLHGLNLKMGRLVLEGAQPTINNLGIDNKLRWYE